MARITPPKLTHRLDGECCARALARKRRVGMPVQLGDEPPAIGVPQMQSDDVRGQPQHIERIPAVEVPARQVERQCSSPTVQRTRFQ